MLILGIESSCDETAAALVDEKGKVIGDFIYSQIEEHISFGGVVPEIAARNHLEKFPSIINELMDKSNILNHEIDGIAVTFGPGLIGGLMVGVNIARGLALGWNKPLLPVNHLEGHALSPRLEAEIDFPYLLLLVSGGHCQLVIIHEVGVYELLGQTLDDAAGEAFDKVAKLLGLGYPGGPAIEQAASFGDCKRYPLPRPMFGKPNCDFSFSGLKSSVRNLLNSSDFESGLTLEQKYDIAASFQKNAVEAIIDRTEMACKRFKQSVAEKQKGGNEISPRPLTLVAAGGVAANSFLREKLEECAQAHGMNFYAPSLKLCTDNAVMIAWAGIEREKACKRLAIDAPKPRFPLSSL